MGRDLADAYFDVPDLEAVPNAMDKEFDTGLGGAAFDYSELGVPARSPSLRDQEYLQQSSLWGHQFVQGKLFINIEIR